MRLNSVLFACGAWLLQQQPHLPPPECAWILAGVLPFAILWRRDSLRPINRVVVPALWLGGGFFWAAFLAHARLAETLPAEWEGRDITIVGIVASLPQAAERSVRFDFDVEQTLTADASVPGRLALAWWVGSARDGATPAALPDINAGERWRFTVRLKRPHGMMNPHGFDYEAALLERGVRATGYVRPRSGAERLDRMVYRAQYAVEALRGKLRDRILRALADAPYAGVIAALAIGDQRAIPLDQWQVFTRTGVNHLMSISGLHITMVAGLVFAFVCALWRRSAWLTLRLPARKAAALAGFLAALSYTLLAGYAVPAQRTLYMLAVIAAALWFGVASAPGTILAAALFAVVALDPWAVLAPGFWLSFGAVAVILFVTLHRVGSMHWLRVWAQTQWAITIALVPLLLALFQQVSLISPVANAFAIPIVSLGVVPLALAGMMLPFDAVLRLAHTVTAVCMHALEWLSAAPAAVWEQQAPQAWAVAAAAAGAVWLLMPRGFPSRALGAVAFLPLFLVLPDAPGEGALRLTVFDVGHGLSVLAQTRHHALVYDAGPAFSSGADTGNRIVVPYLRAAGVRELDGMIVSHDDADHHGGAGSILQAFPVGWLMSSLPDFDPLPLQADDALRCYAGQHWDWDGVRFEVLHPLRASYEESGIRDNDRSCVLRISTAHAGVLLPGDIQLDSEAALLDGDASRLRADVLVVPHQGSRSSSSTAFVAAVHPRAVIFPVGYRNRFGHPHPEVVARYRSVNAALLRTDEDGAVTLTLAPGAPMRLEPYRAVYRRYWHAQPQRAAPVLDLDAPTSGW